MQVKQIIKNKKRFIDLLLLGDEQEDMIDLYLESGKMYALYDDDLKAICVVIHKNKSTCELKNIAIYKQYQRQRYGKLLIEYITNIYKDQYQTMIVGTGETPSTLLFYKSCGFETFHVVKFFFIDNYNHLIFEDSIQLVDMVYLRKELN